MSEKKMDVFLARAIDMYYEQKDGCSGKGHNPGCGKICVECVADELHRQVVAERIKIAQAASGEGRTQEAPFHAFELRISIGANTWEYARQAAQEIAEYLADREPSAVNMCSGGWHGSYSVTLAQREVSPDDFRKELEEWRKNLKS